MLSEAASALEPSLVSDSALLAPARSFTDSRQKQVPASRLPVNRESRILMVFEKLGACSIARPKNKSAWHDQGREVLDYNFGES